MEMKKLLLLPAVLLSLGLFAQIKEGFVKYKTTVSGADGDMASLLSGNSSMSLYFKADRSLSEMVTPLFTMRTLSDSKGTLMLMDGASGKIFNRTPPGEPAPSKTAAEPVVTVTAEKKKILGYDCTKAIVGTRDARGNNNVTIIWFTDKILCTAPTGFVNADVIKKIKGLPLEASLQQGPVQSVITATELSLKPIPDAVFVLSTAGYTEKKSQARARN